MLINFEAIAKLIPAGGSLAISFQNLENGQMRVNVAPKFSEKDMPKFAKGENVTDTAKAISPVAFEDTVENFNAQFETELTELIQLKGQLLRATAEACRTVSTTAAKKKADLKKSLDKKQSSAQKAEAGNATGSVGTFDLFSTKATAAASTTQAHAEPESGEIAAACADKQTGEEDNGEREEEDGQAV
jgi:PRTRC genetic system protein E